MLTNNHGNQDVGNIDVCSFTGLPPVFYLVMKVETLCSDMWQGFRADISTGSRRATLDAARRAHLWLADSGQYDVPRVSSLAGSRAFSVAGPQARCQLPASLHHTNCVATFKRHLKTILFKEAYMV